MPGGGHLPSCLCAWLLLPVLPVGKALRGGWTWSPGRPVLLTPTIASQSTLISVWRLSFCICEPAEITPPTLGCRGKLGDRAFPWESLWGLHQRVCSGQPGLLCQQSFEARHLATCWRGSLQPCGEPAVLQGAGEWTEPPGECQCHGHTWLGGESGQSHGQPAALVILAPHSRNGELGPAF